MLGPRPFIQIYFLKLEFVRPALCINSYVQLAGGSCIIIIKERQNPVPRIRLTKKMPKCMVKGCSNKQRQNGADFSLHAFPKSPTKIKTWLLATGEHFDNVDTFVQQIMEKKKSNTFRICSDHFCPEAFANTPVKRYLKYGAVPSIFPKSKGMSGMFSKKIKKSPSEESVFAMELDSSLADVQQVIVDSDPSTLHQSTSTVSGTGTSSYLCGVFDHDYIENLYYTMPVKNVCNRETNTSIVTFNRSVSTTNYYGRRNASTQTTDLLDKRHARTSTADLYKTKDAWTWTGLSEEMDMATQPQVTSVPSKEVKDFTEQISEKCLSDEEQSPKESPIHEEPMLIDPETETTDIGELSLSNSPSPEDIVSENKFIVFETCLDQLLRAVQRCNFGETCNAPITNREKKVTGTLLTVYTTCANNHQCLFWQSQPMIGKKSCGNILASASILFSGSHFSKVSELFKIFGVPFISKSVHCLYQKQYLFPTVALHHKRGRQDILASLKKRAVCLSGKGQWDRLGFRDKYCTYALIEESTQKIIECNTVQVCESTSSVAVESKAFRKCVQQVHRDGLKIAYLATDKNLGIKKIMREEYNNIKHQFDIWQYCKSLQRKLSTITKQRHYRDLAPWNTAIVKHMRIACCTSKGNVELLRERWNSILHHIVNEHKWDTGSLIKTCAHPEIPETEIRRRHWLDKNSLAYAELERFVKDHQLQKDLEHMTEFCHTSNAEAFQSFVLKYRPNGVNFSMEGIVARTKLAVLSHNAIVDRKRAIIQRTCEGTGNTSRPNNKSYVSKRMKNGQLRTIYETATVDHIIPMVADVIRLAVGELEVTWVPQISLPPAIESTPCPLILPQQYFLLTLT
ncbi:uncharacterized protein LOC134572165 isoform X2 [Pelobates fuscus]|uniref:uncharacterized protein LOC134572165 isoform X2 n=1 Tax=Pelobates fuscus TaxID=191477 RepID=UPI002FE43371